MQRLLMTYTIRAHALDEHLRLLGAVYDELDQIAPAGFSFVTYRHGAFGFVELAAAPALPGPLPAMASFRAYRVDLGSL